MSSNNNENQKVSLFTKFCYSLCEGGEAFTWTYASMYIMYFWSDVVGINMMNTALILFLGRIWDGISDAIIGVLIDKTRTRFGMFRPWIMASIIPTAIANILCFSVLPIGSPTGKMIYGLVTYFLMITCYSMENVAQNAMPSALTLDDGERASFATWRCVGGYAGSILVSNISLMMVARLGGGNDASGFFKLTVLYGFMIVLVFTIACLGLKETVPMPPRKKEKFSLKGLAYLYKGNIPVFILTIAWFGMGFFTYGRSAVAVYYFKYVGGDRTLQGTWASLQMFGSIAGTFLVPILTARFANKAELPKLGWGLGGVLMILLYFMNPADPSGRTLFFTVQFIVGVFLGIATTGIYSMTPDLTEYTQMHKGERAAGSISASVSFFNKCGMAFGSSLSAYLMGRAQYAAGEQQSEQVLSIIRMMFTVVPGVLAIILIAVMCFYRFDRDQYKEAVEQLYGDGS